MSLYVQRRLASTGWKVAAGRSIRASGLMLGLTLGLGLGGGGCGKGGVAGELAAFKESGHNVSEFKEMDAGEFAAKTCQTGTIDQISVLLCAYGSSEAAAQGEGAAERWGSGTNTSIVLRRGTVLLALADRNEADEQGKTLSALARVFRRAKGR